MSRSSLPKEVKSRLASHEDDRFLENPLIEYLEAPSEDTASVTRREEQSFYGKIAGQFCLQ